MPQVVQVSFFVDPQGRGPDRLLQDWPSLVDVAQAASQRGTRVTVIQACGTSARLTRDDVDYRFVAAGDDSPTIARGRAFCNLVETLQPDVFHVHGLGFPAEVAALAELSPGVPILVQDHADRPPRLWQRHTWRRGLRAASAVAFCAREQAEPFVVAGLFAPACEVFEIPEAPSRFSPDDPRLAREQTGVYGDPCLLWVGHLNQNKDPLTVLHGVSLAARQLPELQLWCCFAEAPLLPAVRARIDQDPWLRGKVHLLGRAPHEQVEQLMRAADFFTLGSHREGSGYALIEALACGLPPVVTDIPSFRAITGRGAVGWLWPRGDAHGFCDALLTASSQPRTDVANRPAIISSANCRSKRSAGSSTPLTRNWPPATWHRRRPTMNTLLEVWSLLGAHHRRRLVLLCVVSLGMAVSTVCGVTAVLPFLAALGDTLTGSRTGTLYWLHQYLGFESDRAFVAALGISFVVLVTVANLVNLLGSLLMTRFAFAVGNEFQVAVFDEYLQRDCHFHARNNSATLASKLIHEAGRVTTGILHSALILVTGLATSVLIVGSLVVLNPLVALLVVATLGASYLLLFTVARGRLLRNGRIESLHAARRIQLVNESLGGICEILLLDGRAPFVERFRSSCETLARILMSTLAISQAPKYFLEGLAAATLVGVSILLADPAGGGALWMAQLTFVGFAAYRLLPALQNVYSASVKITADSAAFHNIAGELRLARARTLNVEAAQADWSWHGRPQCEIELTSVCFRYEPNQPYAIRDLSLRIAAGTTVGLVGSNGAGKTTLVDLITGLLTPDSGQISVDGILLDERNRRSWRAAIAYVPQNVFILDATVAENIALGVPAADIDWNALRNATRAAQLEDCIASLPDGYDEMLGERGARLSGGQRQRIARALYRNAAVLILDEGTSALDARAELEVLATLSTLRGRRTIVIITHREPLLQQCDLVVELAAGRVAGHRTQVERPVKKHSLHR